MIHIEYGIRMHSLYGHKKNVMSTTKSNVGKNMSKDKKKLLQNEWMQINDFFETLGEEGPAEDLWKMLKLALITDNDLTEPGDRSKMIFLYESCRELFKNIYRLNTHQKHIAK